MIGHYIDGWRQYATFSGRATRRQFWSFYALHMLVLIGLAAVMSAGASPEDRAAPVLFVLLFLASVPPLWSIGVRRMHDVGVSGTWFFVPYANVGYALRRGEAGPNKYGPAAP